MCKVLDDEYESVRSNECVRYWMMNAKQIAPYSWDTECTVGMRYYANTNVYSYLIHFIRMYIYMKFCNDLIHCGMIIF